MTLESVIKKNRPNISQGSVKTYVSILSNLYRKVANDTNIPTSAEWFSKNKSKIMKYLESLPAYKRKLRLSALVVICADNEDCADMFRTQMLTDIKTYEGELKSNNQVKTQEQKENWMSLEEIKKLYTGMKADVMHILKKQNINSKEHSALMDFVIISLYHLQPPRRLLDYTDMRLNDSKVDNWIDFKNKKFVFGKYKTASSYGSQQVDINKDLLTLLKKWKKYNPKNEWLLQSYDNGRRMTPSNLNQRLHRIFGKKISVNMLRKIYVSEKVMPNLPKITELEQAAHDLGNSVETQMLHYKKSD
jgi:hypothetical protein